MQHASVEIYKSQREGSFYSWRLFVTGIGGRQNEVARMPDDTAAPSKVKRTVRALQRLSGKDSAVWRACDYALTRFELLHPTKRVAAR